ncbi:hypothetical protein DFQ28_004992 [Apophysomyces sp. BC1034]|nr:hypothetical protein DFQ30_004937 [Apophysomyces sp. BC1015]KAG0178055.1 hypothetical protein DFQ29_003996 [Apophysomyces sp. BC1021]KAG0188327.1 hypothetical protein DFQ28_004992 [Apophysomyces sp. BC1034]
MTASRWFSVALPLRASGDGSQVERSMNRIEELFSAAKDEMEYAEESQGSVYYHEDYKTAEKAVKECLEAYDTFLKELPTDEMRNEMKTKVDMKLRELSMAFKALPEEGH